jgi:Tfp pilus assembly protein PilF
LYIPSLGFCVAVAILISRYTADPEGEKRNLTLSQFFNVFRKPVTITAVIVFIFGIKTIARNSDWHDEKKLFTQDVESAPQSVHLHYYLGNVLVSEDQLALIEDSLSKAKQIMEGIEEMNKCVSISPTFPGVYHRRGYMYFMLKDYPHAESDYRKAIELDSENTTAYNYYGMMLFDQGNYAEAIQKFEHAIRINPQFGDALCNLGSVYGTYGQSELELAMTDSSQQAKHLEESKKYFETAIVKFNESIKFQPEYIEPYRMLAEIYKMTGDVENADKYTVLKDRLEKKQKKN